MKLILTLFALIGVGLLSHNSSAQDINDLVRPIPAPPASNPYFCGVDDVCLLKRNGSILNTDLSVAIEMISKFKAECAQSAETVTAQIQEYKTSRNLPDLDPRLVQVSGTVGTRLDGKRGIRVSCYLNISPKSGSLYRAVNHVKDGISTQEDAESLRDTYYAERLPLTPITISSYAWWIFDRHYALNILELVHR